MEKCKRCGGEKGPEDYPPRQGDGKIRRARQCRACRTEVDRVRSARWREDNPEKRRAAYSRYEKKHREERRQRWHADLKYREGNLRARAKYVEQNRDRLNALRREERNGNRVAVLTIYGGRCACCGEDQTEFLALDHVEGGGNQARKTESVNALYARLAKLPPLPAYRLLCHNCNVARGLYGYCPHEVDIRSLLEVS